jgi:hypothetical protein
MDLSLLPGVDFEGLEYSPLIASRFRGVLVIAQAFLRG